MRFHYVQNVEEVLPLVLTDGKAPKAWKRSKTRKRASSRSS